MTADSVQLPEYVQRAVNGRVIKQVQFNGLTPAEWRDVAEHVYGDELRGFFQSGALKSYGRSARRTLFGILDLAVAMHDGVHQEVPHYGNAAKIYQRLKAASF